MRQASEKGSQSELHTPSPISSQYLLFSFCCLLLPSAAAVSHDGADGLNLTIHVYGGSITAMEDGRKSYVAVLAGLLPKAKILNLGMGGTGVAPHLLCGLSAPADIIVSEYRINERDTRRLRKFYDMSRDYSAHTVILDLWSWLTPWRPGEISRTIGAAPNDEKFSVLDLATQSSTRTDFGRELGF